MKNHINNHVNDFIKMATINELSDITNSNGSEMSVIVGKIYNSLYDTDAYRDIAKEYVNMYSNGYTSKGYNGNVFRIEHKTLACLELDDLKKIATRFGYAATGSVKVLRDRIRNNEPIHGFENGKMKILKIIYGMEDFSNNETADNILKRKSLFNNNVNYDYINLINNFSGKEKLLICYNKDGSYASHNCSLVRIKCVNNKYMIRCSNKHNSYKEKLNPFSGEYYGYSKF